MLVKYCICLWSFVFDWSLNYKEMYAKISNIVDLPVYNLKHEKRLCLSGGMTLITMDFKNLSLVIL